MTRSVIFIAAALLGASSCAQGRAPERNTPMPLAIPATAQTAYLAGGCFWCLEAVYELIPGVIDVESGYMGGDRENPSYEEVSGGLTGHAEAVRIIFDPAVVGYAELLETFWKIHDPTTEDRQGADVGSQYRSAIFWVGEEQRRLAAESMAAEGKKLRDPIVTELLPAPKFWPAEAYHQDYFRNHPDQAYCRIVIAPKLRKAGF
jgi:peptide-methionine (S)-S-oxide reductase